MIYTSIVALGIGLMWMVIVFALAKYTPTFAGGGAIVVLGFILLFTILSTQK